MRKLIQMAGCAIVCCGFALNQACVDEAWDLDDVATDDITLGEAFTAPLGTGTISAADLLDTESVEEIVVDTQGNYVARYDGRFGVSLSNTPAFQDVPFALPQVAVPSIPPLGIDRQIPLPDASVPVFMNPTSGVLRLDSVFFHTGPGQSLLQLDIRLDRCSVIAGKGGLRFEITFPDKYDIRPVLPLAEGFRWEDGRLLGELALGVENFWQVSLQIEKIVPTIDDRIGIENPVLSLDAETVLSPGAAPSLHVSGNFSSFTHRVIYGDFHVTHEVPNARIEIGKLSDIFVGENNVLDFYDPRIKFFTSNNIGIRLSADVNLTATGETASELFSTRVDGVSLSAPEGYGLGAATQNIWVGRDAAAAGPAYTFIRNDEIGDLIRFSPHCIDLNSSVFTIPRTVEFIPDAPESSIAYQIDIPLIPGADFRVGIEETIEDVFDKELIDYLFSRGTAEIYGTIENGLPLDFQLEMTVTDAGGNPVGVGMPVQTVAGRTPDGVSSSPVSFKIAEDDIARMEHARDLVLRFTATRSAAVAGLALRPDQSLTLDLKVRTSGGITL
jgi:hypothetical protein